MHIKVVTLEVTLDFEHIMHVTCLCVCPPNDTQPHKQPRRTPRGVLSDNEARDQNVGGEILCQVF